ncbi:3-methyl-2-oxobutanoate hydroxymethyltransferase [Campylobacterota bacterium]|nr:3-methyl-2-oxobutanoate hydroxymethyltransferase [Campylobacterota bacterium]
MSKTTINVIKKLKGDRKIVMITAYDALFARLLADSADILLVGDSLNMSFGGQNDTLSITIDEMIYHTKAVCKGAPESFVVVDMPFGSVSTRKKALKNAERVYRETAANAIKIEGGEERAELVRYLAQNSIAVMGHIGLMPQFARSEGGFKVKGKDEKAVEKLVRDAKAIEEAGAFCIVLEGVKAEAARTITAAVSIPVIGIGAGRETDGQVLVWSDMMGFYETFTPKFARKYIDGANLVRTAAATFREDVISGAFPNADEEY